MTNDPKKGDKLLPTLDRGAFILSQITGKYEPGMCGVDTQQFGCSVSTGN